MERTLIATHPELGAVYEENGAMFLVDAAGYTTEIDADTYGAILESDPEGWEELDDDDDRAFTEVFYEPPRYESWEAYQRVQAECARREAWLMGE